MLTSINFNSDILGTTASSLCLAHCLATPLLFTAHAGSIKAHHAHPLWWSLIDVLFIVLSLVAVYWSATKTSRPWVRYALWSSWFVLAFIIFNEKFDWLPLIEEVIYIPSISLIGLHLYNKKYCRCTNEDCCATV